MRTFFLLTTSFALVLTGCGRDPAATPTSGAAAPAGHSETHAEPRIEPPLVGVPHRIVPATTAAAEYVAALVEPQRIAALPAQVDDFAVRDFHVAPFGTLPRFSSYVAEPLLALDPDLVLTLDWQSQDATAILRRSKIPVLVMRSSEDYESVRDTLALLGRLLGAEQRAAEVTAGLDARVAALRERAALRPKRRALVYTNEGTGGWVAGAHTTAGALLELTGLVNAGAEDGIAEHKQVDMERLLRIAPDLFVCGAPTAADNGNATRAVLLASGPLSQLAAVRGDRIAVIGNALLSADSPMLIDAAEALEREITRLFPDPK